jgi:hypothetical protein
MPVKGGEMKFKEFDTVRLKNNGIVGVVLEVLEENNYLVDFTPENDIYSGDSSHINLITVSGKDLEYCEDE